MVNYKCHVFFPGKGFSKGGTIINATALSFAILLPYKPINKLDFGINDSSVDPQAKISLGSKVAHYIDKKRPWLL